jgi:deoxyribonuclease-4
MALIGAHLSIAGGLWKAIERGEELGCEAAQIFTKNQLQWRTSPLSMNQCEQFYRRWRRSSVRKIVAHASYLINLSTDGTLWKKSVDSLAEEV